MTKPRDPREWDDFELFRQLKRRTAGDRRTRDLVLEAELRLWSKNYEADKLTKATGGVRQELRRATGLIREAVDLMGGPTARPKLRLVGRADA